MRDINNGETDGGDQQMQDLFSAFAPDVADQGFTERAVRRVAWLVWTRRLASTAVVFIALPMLITVLGGVLPPGIEILSTGTHHLGPLWDALFAWGMVLLVWRATEAGQQR